MSDEHPILKLFLTVLLIIADIVGIIIVNTYFGPYLTAPFWALILIGFAVFDIWVYVRVFR